MKWLKCILKHRNSHQRCSRKKGVYKRFRKIYRKTPMLESLFLKKDTGTGVFMFKNIFFIEYLRANASANSPFWKIGVAITRARSPKGTY